jgi:hypothetical protein
MPTTPCGAYGPAAIAGSPEAYQPSPRYRGRSRVVNPEGLTGSPPSHGEGGLKGAGFIQLIEFEASDIEARLAHPAARPHADDDRPGRMSFIQATQEGGVPKRR